MRPAERLAVALDEAEALVAVLEEECERALAACRRKRKAQRKTAKHSGSPNFAGWPPWVTPPFGEVGRVFRTPGAGNITGGGD